MSYFGPFPNTTHAYATDISGNEYFGEAAKGCSDPTRARWTIFQKLNTGGAANPTAWIMQYPLDTTSNRFTDQPMFVWNHATDGTYVYGYLDQPGGI